MITLAFYWWHIPLGLWLIGAVVLFRSHRPARNFGDLAGVFNVMIGLALWFTALVALVVGIVARRAP